ncbi:phage holin family protein [Streptomyces sp. NPDC051940]|uniref:phage holin family protein n=1 Tax=Streptomyces sp. NPDC051940 TaxID=3155675 RepID=UPI00341F4B69
MGAPADEHVERSLGQLVAGATADMSALIHDEIALAKAELREDVKKAGIGSAATVAGGALVLFGIPVLSFAGAYGLHEAGIWLWASFLIVFGVHVLLGAIVALVGVRFFKKVNKPEKTIASVQETVHVFSGVRPGGRRPEEGRVSSDGVKPSAS